MKKKKSLTRDDMAYVYAGLMGIKDYPFDVLNQKIMSRWSFSGLVYIKEKAWKIREQLHEELE